MKQKDIETNHQKILVTGGAGFIGSHLVDYLLSQGHSVTVLDNLRNGSLENLKAASVEKKFHFIKGDITDLNACVNSTQAIDTIYHLACLGVRHSLHSPLENHEVNAGGTLKMLEAARINKAKRFFYISTSEIYGKVSQFPISEKALPRPITVYGSSKLVGENYALSYKEYYGLDTVVLRIYNNFGPRAHYEGDSGEVLPRSIVRTLQDKCPVIFGDGKVTRDFFFVKDTARALSTLLAVQNFPEERIINIGTGTEITIKELLEMTLEAMGEKKIKPQYLAARPADVPRLWVDATRFYALTGFKAEYSLMKGLQETIAYYRELHAKGKLIEVPIQNWEKTANASSSL